MAWLYVSPSRLDRIRARGSEVVVDKCDDGAEREVVHLHDPNALTQVVGHVKFAFAPHETVIFRGQSSLFSRLTPSGFRGVGPSGRNGTSSAVAAYVRLLFGRDCLCDADPGAPHCTPNWPCQDIAVRRRDRGVVSGTPTAATEPLLQHYGLQTRWLDVVDNVWIALWFACHKLEVDRHRRFAHHVRRSVAQEPNGFSYIPVLSAGAVERTKVAGVFRSSRARLADLRYAVPSVYLRPHAQHGLLLADHSWDANRDPDLLRLELVTLRIHLRDALDWLGAGRMLSPYVLFPPPTRDEGFGRLLEDAPEPPVRLGRFLVYGPGT